MLETVREYALEQLDASGEHPVTRRAHAAYCLVLAEEGLGPITAAQREEWLARCQREHDNHRAAFDHLIATHDADWALRLALALSDYWDRRDHRARRLRPLRGAAAAAGAGGAHQGPGHRHAPAAACSAPVLEATKAEQEALSIYRELGDLRGVVGQLNNLGVNHRFIGDYDGARAWLEESVSICRQLGDRAAVATALSNLADVRRRQGHYADARAALEEAHDLFGQAGHTIGQAWSLNHLGDVARIGRRSGRRARPLPARRRSVPRRSATRWAWRGRRSISATSPARKATSRPRTRCSARRSTRSSASTSGSGVAIALEAFACAAIVERRPRSRADARRRGGGGAAERAAPSPPARSSRGRGVERRIAELWALDDRRRAAPGATPARRCRSSEAIASAPAGRAAASAGY